METGVTFVEATDPRVEVYRDLKGRDLAGRPGDLFILEGENSINNLVKYGFRIPLVSVCLSERRVAPMRALIARLHEAGVPVYALRQDALEAVVGFHFHRGVLGCGRKLKPKLSPEDFLESLPPPGGGTTTTNDDAPLVLCEQMNNLDNVGSIIRTAAALGARAVLFDAKSSDPYYRKSLRVSGGHALALPFSRSGTIRDVILAARGAGYAVAALVTPHSDKTRGEKPRSIVHWWRDYASPRSLKWDDKRSSLLLLVRLLLRRFVLWRSCPPLRRRRERSSDFGPRRVALLVGAEGPGLSQEAVDLADACVTVPMAPDVDSLNVVISAAVALHEVISHPPRPDVETPALRRPGSSRGHGALVAALASVAPVGALVFMMRRRRTSA